MSVNRTNEQIDLTGQVAVVTGGGRGIGRAIAQALAAAGASVAVVARTADQLTETVALVEKAGGCAVAYPADVTDQFAIERAVAQVEQQLGPVDLLVNNAGIGGPVGPAWENDPGAWWRCIDVNLRGPYLCSRAVLPGMVTRRRGRIITTASGAGVVAGRYGSAYNVSKTAVIRLTEILAAETREHGISSFAIGPGFTRTALTEAQSPDVEKWLGWVRKRLAEGRYNPPERATPLVLYLASGRADALSGCYITVSDDVVEMASRAQEIQKDKLYTLRLRT